MIFVEKLERKNLRVLIEKKCDLDLKGVGKNKKCASLKILVSKKASPIYSKCHHDLRKKRDRSLKNFFVLKSFTLILKTPLAFDL